MIKLKKKYKRNCPKCGKELVYIQKSSRNDAERKNRICMSCSKKGHIPWNIGLTKKDDVRLKNIGKQNSKKLKEISKSEKTRENMRVPKSFRSEEHKKKLSKINSGEGNPMFGKKHSKKTKEKMSINISKNHADFSGEKHPRWNPRLTKEERIKRRNITEWVQFRNDCLKNTNYTCQLTQKRGISLAVHHLDGWAKFPDKRYSKTNIIVINKDLHDKFHKIYGKVDFTKDDFFKFVKEMK